jgi:predicted permease
MIRDLRFALRSLGRAPVFALSAAAVLALGIGANTTVFTIVNTVLLRPLPFARAADIVEVRRRTPFGSSGSFSMHDYTGVREQRDALDALAILDVFSAGRYTLITPDAAEPITACRVSARFFDVFGVSPVVGRLFADGDDALGAPLTAVVTRGFWRRRFASDPSIVGRSLTIGGQPYTVVGVAPDAMTAFGAAEIYLSLPVPEASRDRTNSFQVVGRVRNGSSRAQAEARIDAIARRHAAASAALTNMPDGVVLRSLQDDLVSPVRPALRALTVAVGFVLLIACSNVANLALARTLSRRRELAVMTALGASRWRVVRRLFAESLVVATAGGVGGLLLAGAGVRTLLALSPVDLPQADRIHIDLSVLAFVALTTLAAAILAGLPPALQLARRNLADWIKDGGGHGGTSASSHRIRVALTLSQIALSTVLLVGAGLLTRSFWRLASVDPGFRADGVLTLAVSATPARYPDSARLGAYTAAVSHRLEQIPGVMAVSSTTALPSEFPIDFPVSPVGGTNATPGAGRSTDIDAWYRAIDPHYFTAMGIPLIAGRVTTDDDSARSAPVVIVSQSLARTAFPNDDALGRSLVLGTGYLRDARDLRPRTIVGIVGDTREQGLRFAPTATIYLPVAQAPELITQLVLDKIPVRWVVRTSAPRADLAAAIRAAVLAVDATQPPSDFARLSAVLARSIATHRFNMLMVTLFGALALTLAATGVYGLTAYAVAERTREIGIRLSLGASPAVLVRSLLVQGLRLCLTGAAVGIAGALLLGRLLQGLLFGVTPTDGVTIVVVFLTIVAVVSAATYLPALRAARLDPLLALRRD